MTIQVNSQMEIKIIQLTEIIENDEKTKEEMRIQIEDFQNQLQNEINSKELIEKESKQKSDFLTYLIKMKKWRSIYFS